MFILNNIFYFLLLACFYYWNLKRRDGFSPLCSAEEICFASKYKFLWPTLPSLQFGNQKNSDNATGSQTYWVGKPELTGYLL